MGLSITRKVLFKLRQSGFSGLWAYGKRFLKAKIWTAVAILDRRYGYALVARDGNHTYSFTLWPRSIKRIYFRNVKKGSYLLEVQHGDRWIGMNRKALIARFRLFSGPMNVDGARQMGLGLGDDGRPFAYLGGGRRRNDFVVQNARVEVLRDERWLRLDLHVPPDRVVNIDGISLRGIRPDVAYMRSAMLSFIDSHPAIHDAEFILYADIDLNVVDGSSVWLSSMASILCGLGKCVLLAKSAPKSQIVLSNIHHSENLTLITPAALNLQLDRFSVDEACEALRVLDARLPRVRNIVVRGLDAAAALHETRQFRERSAVYLTDFYVVTDNQLTIDPARAQQAAICVMQAGTVLVQTPLIESKLKATTQTHFKTFELPPPIPDALPQIARRNAPDGVVRIGYAGKINPDWGIEELLDWVGDLNARGRKIELHIVANKISDGTGGNRIVGFRESILAGMKRANAIHHKDFNRDQAMSLMADMDFVWCWRPARLEENTLEISTKLIEMAASGARCICYPNAINKSALGAKYPFFVREKDDLPRVLDCFKEPPEKLRKELRKKHGLSGIRERLRKDVLREPSVEKPRRISVAGHDYKFIDGYISYLKSLGHHVVRDEWGWGEPTNIERSRRLHEWAEIVFCEWGLANAVWHSNNRQPGKRVFIRAHLQEINERARKFGPQIKLENVEKVIFVSANVRDQALKLFKWPVEKTVVIPNFVLADEYRLAHRELGDVINLGMVGITPQRKRFDRAVDTLLELRRRGHQARLHIKGPRPETLEFMHAPGRKAELDYYQEVYRRIDADPLLADNVHFDPWGNDVALWYRKVEHILSCSDYESFHYALADGVLTGCQPLVWPWEEAELLYTRDWIVADVKEAADRIEAFRALAPSERSVLIDANRDLVVERYGHEQVFRQLNEAIGI